MTAVWWIVIVAVGCGLMWANDRGKGSRGLRAGERLAANALVVIVVGMCAITVIGIVWTIGAVLLD